MQLIKIFWGAIITLVLLVALFFCVYINSSINIKEDFYLYIKNGDNFSNVTKTLAENSVIKNRKIFILSSKILNKNNTKVYRGEFLIEKHFKVKDVINSLLKNKVYYRSITFAEGLSTNSIVKILNKEENLIDELDPDDFQEGIFLPDTYKYIKGDTKLSILNRMKNAMNEFIDSVWDNRTANKWIKDKYDLLKLASIIEKETSIDSERPIVASVFFNRLDKGMRLQTDPTVIYSFAFGNTDLERRIKKSDLLKKVPYNTYKNYGLTPTPICNPGRKSILAVLFPEKTDYLYFVADESGNGQHKFSKDYKTHRGYVKKYIDSQN